MVHGLDFIGLSQAVPGSEVLRINFDCLSIGVYGSSDVFELEILMAHESPSREALFVEFDGSFEIGYCFHMFANERVVVANDAARFTGVFIVFIASLGEVCKLAVVLLYV